MAGLRGSASLALWCRRLARIAPTATLSAGMAPYSGALPKAAQGGERSRVSAMRHICVSQDRTQMRKRQIWLHKTQGQDFRTGY